MKPDKLDSIPSIESPARAGLFFLAARRSLRPFVFACRCRRRWCDRRNTPPEQPLGLMVVDKAVEHALGDPAFVVVELAQDRRLG